MTGYMKSFISRREHAARYNGSISHFLISFILFFFYFTLLYVNQTWKAPIGDTTRYFNDSVRFYQRDLPYRDFWLFYLPGDVLLAQVIYGLFGFNTQHLFIAIQVINAAIGVTAYLIGNLLYNSKAYAVLTSFIVFFNSLLNLEIYLLPLFAASIFVLIFIRKNVRYVLFLSGLCIGCAFLFKIYEVLAFLLALCIVLLFHHAQKQKPYRETLFSYAALYAGMTIIIGIALFFWRDVFRQIWGAMWQSALIDGVVRVWSIRLPYFFDSWKYFHQFLTAMNGGLSLFAIYSLVFCLYMTFLYLLPAYIGFTVVSALRNPPILLFFLWGVFSLPKAISRADAAHLSFSLTPLLFLILRPPKKYFDGRWQVFFHRGILALLLAPAAVCILFAGYNLTLPHFTVSAANGSLILIDRSEVQTLRQVITFITAHSQERDYMFVTPIFAPPFNALTGRKNPTAEDSLSLILDSSVQKQQRICDQLLSHDTKLVIHSPDWGIDDRADRQFLPAHLPLQHCIETNFRLQETYGRYKIYVR